MRALPSFSAAVAAGAAVVLGLSACGTAPAGTSGTATPTVGSTASSGSTPVNDAADLKVLDSITVTFNSDAAKEPTVTFGSTPVKVSHTAVKTLKQGTGAASTSTSRVSINEVLFLGTTGKKLDSNWGKSPQSFSLSNSGTIPGLNTALTGVKAGSRILFAIPPAEAFGTSGNTQAGISAEDALIVVATVSAVVQPLTKATGTAVAPKSGLPTVTFDDTTGPKITVPKTAPSTTLVSQDLIDGKGSVVTTGQSVTVEYTGVVYSTGAVFDSSWGKKPFTFQIGASAVITGWDKGLIGKKVGSRVLLVVPPGEGYGANANGSIPANSTLVFVVDILDAG